MSIRLFPASLVGLLLAARAPAMAGAEPEAAALRPVWDLKTLMQSPRVEWLDPTSKVRSLLYEAEPYQGRPTKVFAYYASPATLGLARGDGARFPAVVLVHGGMGDAFAGWAETLAKRGYAAIALGHNGRNKNVPEDFRGPPDADDRTIFAWENLADTDFWQYHAVADVIRAHSLLRSLPEVDADRTAIWGISWGGYLTCIVAGLDSRFKAAVPMYGCGFYHLNGQWAYKFRNRTPEQVARWVRLWDPSSYVGSATMPMLFINGGKDAFYPLDSYAKTYHLVTAPKNISVQLDLRHAHIYDQKEALLFLDQHLRDGPALPRVTRLTLADGGLAAQVQSQTQLTAAQLHYTSGPHQLNKSREWVTKPLTLDAHQITGEAPPAEATVFFVTITDERGAVVSSELTVK